MAKDIEHTRIEGAEGRTGLEEGGFDGLALKDTPGHLIRRAQQRHQDIFAEEVGPKGPTSRQFAVMLVICQRPGLTQTELVEATGVDRSTIGDMLDRLTKRGLIERRPVERDGRANSLWATAAGRRMVKAAMPGVARTQVRILAAVPPALHATALEILRKLAGIE